MLNGCSSFECWSNIPSLMQAWIWYFIPALFGYFAAKRETANAHYLHIANRIHLTLHT